MKKLALFLIVFLAVILIAGSWTLTTPLTWNTGESSVTGFITAEVDTSDRFDIAKLDEFQTNWLMPETITVTTKTIEGTNTDSTNLIIGLWTSNDGTNWLKTNIDTLLSTTTDTGATIINHINLTDFHMAKYGQVWIYSIAGAGDTNSVYIDVALDYSNY